MSASDGIRLSIALVTRNRPDRLDATLADVRRQSAQPFEIVVSDDSTSEYAADVRAVADRWDCRYLPGPRRGLYANRNHVAVHCSGSHIRTMDDDHTLPAGHLAACLNTVRADPGALWTTGEVGFVDGRFYAALPTASQLWPWGGGGAVADPDDNWAIADGSTIYPRDVFTRGFRMVEDFGFGSSYLEFGAYLYHHGYRSRCIPDCVVHHHARQEELTRGGLEMTASRLFASVCYNRYFRPNPARAAFHVGSHVLRHGQPLRLASRVPGILARAKQRWLRPHAERS